MGYDKVAASGQESVSRIRQEVAETSSLVALVAAGLGVALAPASVRHLRISGVIHWPLRGPAQTTVMLAAAYKKGPVSQLIRGYLETTRAVLRSQKQPSSGPSFNIEPPSLPESI